MSRKIWRDFGVLVTGQKTAASAMQKARLGWNVCSKEIQVVDGPKIEGRVAIVRSDTNDVLGIVNSSYKSVQNLNVFSFLDKFVQNGDAIFHAAGFIGKGEKVWLLLKLLDNIKLPSGDSIQKFILFSNAHDGRGAIRAYFLPIRESSQTLMNISFGKRVEQGIALRHVGKVQQRIDESKKIFDLAEKFYENFEDSICKLYKSVFNARKIEMFIESTFSAYSLDSTRAKNNLAKIKQQHELESKKFPSSSNSAWSWFCSVTNYIDFERLSKGSNHSKKVSNHLESLFWGNGLLLKQKAWESIQTLIKL
jgi:phage/plasmid-like protein (TIGR03299 family)